MTPPPLLVAVTGSRERVSKVVASVKKQLLRRGLQVDVGGNPLRKAAEETDIVLIPYPHPDWKQLACDLEERWNRQWLTWYTLTRSDKML